MVGEGIEKEREGSGRKELRKSRKKVIFRKGRSVHRYLLMMNENNKIIMRKNMDNNNCDNSILINNSSQVGCFFFNI